MVILNNLSKDRVSAVDVSLFVVISFGLCGAFVSNISGLPKIHYAPLLIASLIAFFRALNKQNIIKYTAAFALAAASPIFANDANSYLSYFSTIVLPALWFCAGQHIHPEKLANWLLALSWLLIAGILLEISNSSPGLFPYIGVKLGDESAQRYGSFALNPLALGYFASMSGALFILVKSHSLRYTGIATSILLLGAANSRGGIVTFFFTLLIFWFFHNRISPNPTRISRSLRYSGYMLAIGAAIVLILSNPRLGSIFDWTGDEGNLGRLNQWGYCLTQITNNPLQGLGAGAMSPIGIGDDPYIEEGIVKSCDSTLLKIGVEYNSIAAISYFLLIAILIARVIPKRPKKGTPPKNTNLDKEYVASISIICSVFLQQLLNQTLESVWIGAMFFCLLGYCHTKIKMQHTAPKKAPPQRNPPNQPAFGPTKCESI